jgi:hypothetical protein
MKIQLQAKSSGQNVSHFNKIDAPCKVTLEIGKRLVIFEVDKDEGVRIVGDTGSPEDNAT